MRFKVIVIRSKPNVIPRKEKIYTKLTEQKVIITVILIKIKVNPMHTVTLKTVVFSFNFFKIGSSYTI